MSEAQWQQIFDATYAKVSRYTWEDATDRFEVTLDQAIERSIRITI